MLRSFKVVLEPNESGGYTVYVPLLPGCISEGDTREEALANIKEAIELYKNLGFKTDKSYWFYWVNKK